MTLSRSMVGLMAALLLPAVWGTASAKPEFRVAPEPAWVDRIEPDLNVHGDAQEMRGGVHDLLVDRQTNRTIDPPEAYWHSAHRVVNEDGVPELSQFLCSFDPTYQELVLHRIDVHRDGKVLHRLDPDRVAILRREERLEYQIYDGAKTANLILDDVRVGDVVEYSYTIRGSNPVLRSHFEQSWIVGAVQVPERLNLRLRWPSSRPLYVHPWRTGVRPKTRRVGDAVEYTLSLTNVPTIEIESGIPSWYRPYPEILFSDFANWNAVARWGQEVFLSSWHPSADVDAKVAEIRRAHGQGTEAAALAAIRFVQEDIRYLGLELGEWSHRPTAAGIVLGRRFGDCKDKVLLLATLLRKLGFDADPAFVSTSEGDSLASRPAVLALLDHAILRLHFRDRIHWVDATLQGQRGSSLDRLSTPEVGCALVLASSTQAPTRLSYAAEMEMVTFEKSIDASRTGDPARLEVKTVYRGSFADAMRRRMRGSNQRLLAKTWLGFYREVYSNIAEASAPVFDDDEDLNTITTVESYDITDFWAQDSTVGPNLSAIELAELLPKFPTGHRKMPLSLAHPIRVLYSARFDGPDEWDVKDENESIESSAFQFSSRRMKSGQRLEVFHEYASRKGVVHVGETDRAAADLDQVYENIGLYVGGDGSAGGSGTTIPMGIILTLAALTLMAFGAVHVYRMPAPVLGWPRVALPAEGAWNSGQPIGGWLYLLAVGQFLSPLAILYWLLSNLAEFDANWSSLQGSGFFPALLAFELIGQVFLLVGSVLCLVLFVQRRRIFPPVYLVTYSLGLLFDVVVIVGLAVDGSEPEVFAEQFMMAVRGGVSLVIWASYLARSRRAEATFVR